MINEPFDYSNYGVFNGKPTLSPYNRQYKRKYIKEHKHNKYSKYCKHCNAKTMWFTDDNCDWVCELCGFIVEKKGDSNE